MERERVEHQRVIELLQKFLAEFIDDELRVAAQFLQTDPIEERGQRPEEEKITVDDRLDSRSKNLPATSGKLISLAKKHFN